MTVTEKMSTLYNIVSHVFKNVGATHVTLKKKRHI